jgi:hypothetical protein
MLNIHGDILDLLNESEYYLFSILLNYGTKSCPDNSVLLHRTGWGLNKLQTAKKSLISKGLLNVEARFNPTKGAKGRESNAYVITTDLASKYNDKLIRNKLVNNKVVKNKLVDNKLVDNRVYKELLKPLIIETKVIIEKKEEKIYPDSFSSEIIGAFDAFVQMRKQIRKPIKNMPNQIKILERNIKKFGDESVIDALVLSIENEYQGYFPKETKNPQPKQEEQPQDLETYLLQYFRPIDLEHLKKGGNFQRYEQQLSENLFKLTNVAKGYKNESITPLFLFELLYTPLGNRLNGSTPERKLDSFERFFKKLTDYNQNQGDMRQLVKDLAQTQ